MTTIIGVLDAFRDLMPVPTNTIVDESASDPLKVLPARLYCWPRRLLPQKLEEANLRWGEADLRLGLLYTVAAKGEGRSLAMSRDVSEQLDQIVTDVHDAVKANRRHPFWWDVYIDNVAFDAIRSYDVRGARLDIVVRLNDPLPDSASGS